MRAIFCTSNGFLVSVKVPFMIWLYSWGYAVDGLLYERQRLCIHCQETFDFVRRLFHHASLPDDVPFFTLVEFAEEHPMPFFLKGSFF